MLQAWVRGWGERKLDALSWRRSVQTHEVDKVDRIAPVGWCTACHCLDEQRRELVEVLGWILHPSIHNRIEPQSETLLANRVFADYFVKWSSCCCSVAKSYPTLCDSMDCSLPGSSVHGILQARILEWVTIPFSRGSRLDPWVSCIAGGFFTVWATREAQGMNTMDKHPSFLVLQWDDAKACLTVSSGLQLHHSLWPRG